MAEYVKALLIVLVATTVTLATTSVALCGGVLIDVGGDGSPDPETALYTGSQSPAHHLGLVTGQVYNGVNAENKSTGWVNEVGIAVDDFSLTWGLETGDLSRTVSYAIDPTTTMKVLDGNNYFAGTAEEEEFGVFGNALGGDQILRNSGSEQGAAGVALKLEGLPLGVYDLLLTAYRGYSGQAAYDYDVYITTGASDVTDFTTLTPIATLVNSSDDSWLEDDNYVSEPVTLTAGAPNIYIFIDGFLDGGVDAGFAVLNSLEITSDVFPDPELGDFNSMDGITLIDYDILANNLFTGTLYEEGDVNFDGQVDLADFAIFRDLYAAANPGAAALQWPIAIPEPNSLTLAALIAVVFMMRRSTANSQV